MGMEKQTEKGPQKTRSDPRKCRGHWMFPWRVTNILQHQGAGSGASGEKELFISGTGALRRELLLLPSASIHELKSLRLLVPPDLYAL